MDFLLSQTVSTTDFSDGLDVGQQLAEKGRSLGRGLPVCDYAIFWELQVGLLLELTRLQ